MECKDKNDKKEIASEDNKIKKVITKEDVIGEK